MNKTLTLIGVFGVTTLVLGILFTVSTVGAVTAARISVSQGLTLADVVAAIRDQDTREEKGLKNILVFSKSGGSLEIGNFQPNLRVDLPVNVNHDKKEVSFQYFVETKDDLTGSLIFHCTDVRLHVYVDKNEVFVTDWLGYQDRDPALSLQTEKITMSKISPGDHSIGLIPEGRLGGCNTQGYLLSWGGTAAIFK
ncbi:MAG: hypothetical protein AUH37_01525 [Candidatus Nitrososphaera sp. 13_1_40CM_48_12]|nr:MAG: hypothetical protein AUH37_01525 [Candidatus Nitrososphaera sp. 13_1_40CM_48_12]